MGKIGKTGKTRGSMSSGQVAEMLGISRRTVSYKAKKGELPLVNCLDHYRFPTNKIKQIAKNMEAGGTTTVKSTLEQITKEDRYALDKLKESIDNGTFFLEI